MLSVLQDRGYDHPLAVTASVSKGQQGTHSKKGAEPAAGSSPVREGSLKPRPAPASAEARNNPEGLSCPRLEAPRFNLSAKRGARGAEPRRGVRGPGQVLGTRL